MFLKVVFYLFTKVLKCIFFYFNEFQNVIYFFDVKAEFLPSLFQSSVMLHDQTEIILIC